MRYPWLRKNGWHVFVTVVLCSLPLLVRASATDGTIDVNHTYAWGSQIGWVNFGTAGGDVHVTDAGLTGYAWDSDYGWINLAPTKAGVKNDGNGHLSGYGWGQNIGYVNFGGVTINGSGQFAGTATSSVGTITFDCSNCTVITDWRPASVRNNGGGGGGGGGGAGVAAGSGGGTGYIVTSTVAIPQVLTGNKNNVADFDGDGRVNIIDLSILLSYYGQSCSISDASRYCLDHAGVIDFPDISILMYHWTG